MVTRLITLGLTLSLTLCVENSGDDPLDWLRDSLPGEPGVDYPILASVQETSFSCSGLIFGGYYADPEQQCQAYHICLSDPLDLDTLYPVSFLCPNGTIFNQEIFVCDWWFNVDCGAAVSLYGAVEGAFGSGGGVGGGGDAGECPAAPVRSEEECAGSVSNCWSPGQRDTDCPNNGLCCYDGCADTCVDGPKPTPPPYEPPVQPIEAETEEKPDYQPPPTPTTTTTTEGYEYPVPEEPLEFPAPKPPPPELPTLYGPPSV